MRILQINNYHYLRGGSERVYFETSKLLEEKGHKVIHFSVNDNEALESPYKQFFIEPVDYLDNGFLRKIKFIPQFICSKEAKKKLESLVKAERPDIAHLHIFYGRITSSILPVLKKYNIPTVMTVHEYKMLCPVYLLINNKGKICEKCANGNYLHCVLDKCNRNNLLYSFVSAFECYIRDYFCPYETYIGKFIMVSEFIRDKYLQYKRGLKDKTCQIYNFINLDSFTPDYRHGDYYLYAGRLSREKGVMTLLRTWRHFSGINLKIAGDGPLKHDMLRYIQENGMENVQLVGYLTGQSLSDLLRNSKYLIAPSEWYETFGLNIAEAFACGKPVIAANIGAIPELVKEGVNGFLFETKNEESLTRAVKLAEGLTKDVYMKMSQEARRHVEERFNKDIYYDKLMGVYMEVAQK